MLDVADLIFTQADVDRAAAVLRDVQKYPDTVASDLQIAERGIRAFILHPCKRIEGTESGRFLVIEIDNYLKQVFAAPPPITA